MERKTVVDAMDRRLLELLIENPRLSNRALARAIGMSPSAVGERLDRLQKRGVIRGFTAEVDLAALGYALEVVVAIQLRQGKPVRETVEQLRSIKEVRSIQLVTGRWDLLLTFQVRDQLHLREILLGEVWAVADFQHSESMIVLQTWTAPTPLRAAFDEDDEPDGD
ncbi:transcriptional regulator, AsnC family [Pseudonocardia thermophila]|uniref:Transcriptional regulator, AsnC family n=1 Tax=Pseudonocardia thermophila TaxID=1848 RepID=A0A1M6P8A3_PSETH|nr:Lrp/AsnC family transcriptional regulator [Pseudonocardia thermophila]SHK04140.1 transcriptional regulator, AsnC family [Pseudonocardia thermophila]